MGFDWAHMISSISKLILRSARNAVDGGSGDNGSKDSQFESICNEFNHNKLMKKYQGYAQNENFKVGLNGKTVNNEKIREESSFYNWLEDALKKLPGNVEAVNFNLYDDGDNKWSVELVGSSTFDENNSDWACNEVYTTRENPYVLTKKSDWKAIENLFTTFLLNYLERGKYTQILKECRGIGIGFVDGDLSILYKKDKRKVAEETIESLLEKYKDREGFLSMLDEYGRDIFTHIISNEAEETALKALYAIDDVNREDRYGYSYLTFAGVGHKVKVIEELLRMGADPNHKSNPLLKALGRKSKDNPAILKLFIQYGVDLTADVNGSTIEDTIRSFGVEALNPLIYNEDRHFGNFGLLRNNHTGEIIAPAPIFDNGLSLFNYAMPDDFKNLRAYAKTRSNPYRISYEDVCKEVMGAKQKAQLRRMVDFKFTRHPSLNLPEERLTAIEKQLGERTRELLSIPVQRSTKLKNG